MEDIRFDHIAKVLGARPNRRLTLAALLGGALGLLGLAESEARKSGKCKPKCDECEKCKRGDCDRKDGKKRCEKGKCKPKADGASCRGGRCCGGVCVNTGSDPRNCGSCGKRCALNEVCEGGTCVCPDPSGVCRTFRPGTTCCPRGDDDATPGLDPTCVCIFSDDSVFTDAANCNTGPSCPQGSTPCIGGPGTCRACCPPGSTCDTRTGACLQ